MSKKDDLDNILDEVLNDKFDEMVEDGIEEDEIQQSDEYVDEIELGEDEEFVVNLTLDDDTEIECVILNIFEAENGQKYISLIPSEQYESDSDKNDLFIYRFAVSPSGDPLLGNIETEEEYFQAAEAFDKFCDENGLNVVFPHEENM